MYKLMEIKLAWDICSPSQKDDDHDDDNDHADNDSHSGSCDDSNRIVTWNIHFSYCWMNAASVLSSQNM